MTRKRFFKLVFCCGLIAFVVSGQGRGLNFFNFNIRNALTSVGQNQTFAKASEILGGRQTSVKRAIAWITKQLKSLPLKGSKLLHDYWDSWTKEEFGYEHRQESKLLDHRPDIKKEQLNRESRRRPKLLNHHLLNIKKVRPNRVLRQESKPLHYYRDTRQQEEQWDSICRNKKHLRYHRCMGKLRNAP